MTRPAQRSAKEPQAMRQCCVAFLPARHILALRPIALTASCLLLLCLGSAGCGSGLSVASSSSTLSKAAPNGPQLGYAWNSADATLRPLLGIPGAAQVGASVLPASTYVAAGASVRSGMAVLVGHDGAVYRMSLPNGTPSSLGTAVPIASRVHLSPSGTAAVLYTSGGTSATVVTALSGIPVVRNVSLSGAAVDLAVSDSGTVAAVLGTSVSVLPATAPASVLASLKGTGSVSFTGTADNLLIADAGANTLVLIRLASTAPAATLLPTAGLLRNPLAVNSTMDSHWAVLANRADSSIVRVDLTGASAPQSIACPSHPTIVDPLAGSGVFRFTDIGSTPTWLADMGSATPTMRFVPALPSVGP